jgi:ABC-type dipeptide/oligopeptide/nickel transport system permease component
MIGFLLRRMLQSFAVLLAVAFVAFAMFNFVGDPVAGMVGPDTSIAEREVLRERLGLNRSSVGQYLAYLGNVAQGDFGRSYRTAEPVARLILSRVPASVELSLVGALFAFTVGVLAGVYCGLHPRRWLARIIMAVSLVGVSLPTFLIGILLIVAFSVALPWLPSFGRGAVVELGWWNTGFLTWSGLKSLILPSVTLGLFQMALIMRLVRAEMLEVLRTDYIRFARARGLSDRAVHFRHALKNTLVPVITVAGLQLGALIAFTIVTETVFAWPGIGQLFVQSVQSADIPVMASYLVMVGLIFVLINLVVDLLYFAVDPRLRTDAAAPAH